jgi:cell division protein FtsQ
MEKSNRAKVSDFVTKKMGRLEKFYKYGLSQAGWNKYSSINLEFDNQIICKKRDSKDLDDTETTPEPKEVKPTNNSSEQTDKDKKKDSGKKEEQEPTGLSE